MIAVNSIAPAMTETPLFKVLTEVVLARAIAAMPHGDAMQPDEIAAWVSFLISPAGDICSGNVIILNQGRDVKRVRLVLYGPQGTRCQFPAILKKSQTHPQSKAVSRNGFSISNTSSTVPWF